ncbi:MAG: endolytic transglycosylase MltG [Halioglobus sp.]
MIRKLLLALLVLVLLAGLAFKELEKRWQQPLKVPALGFVLTVAAGDSLRTVVNTLSDRGILTYPNLVVLYGRWTGLDQQIKQGEYLLPEQLTAEALLLLLQNGKVIQYQVTLPEGITLARALSILAQAQELEHVLAGSDDERLSKLVQPHQLAEGLFFPDSYHYVRGATDWQIVQRAHSTMQAVLQLEWQNRAQELPYETAYEALIMASIIERETGMPQERQQIAGVFVRRLQRGMRLQTDPTVIYGLGDDFDGNLRRKHLADSSNPYNSYRHSGLPPGPIALPGQAAIHAALHPAAGDALYFVARGDGGHVFSATLAEHEQAVRKYQLQRRKNYRSTPEKQ